MNSKPWRKKRPGVVANAAGRAAPVADEAVLADKVVRVVVAADRVAPVAPVVPAAGRAAAADSGCRSRGKSCRSSWRIN